MPCKPEAQRGDVVSVCAQRSRYCRDYINGCTQPSLAEPAHSQGGHPEQSKDPAGLVHALASGVEAPGHKAACFVEPSDACAEKGCRGAIEGTLKPLFSCSVPSSYHELFPAVFDNIRRVPFFHDLTRSEEHTSELQSHLNL